MPSFLGGKSRSAFGQPAFLFSSRRRACLVLKHNRVSEVFKGFKVHDFEYLLRSKKLHLEIEFMSLEMCHLLWTSKNY